MIASGTETTEQLVVWFAELPLRSPLQSGVHFALPILHDYMDR